MSGVALSFPAPVPGFLAVHPGGVAWAGPPVIRTAWPPPIVAASPGSIGNTGALVFTVTLGSSSLSFVADVCVAYADGSFEPVASSVFPGDLTPLYAASGETQVGAVYTITIRRSVPWSRNPSLVVQAFDSNGNTGGVVTLGPWTVNNPVVAGPVIGNPMPAAGTSLGLSQPVSVDVSDATGTVTALSLSMAFPNGSADPVYTQGVGFWPLYKGSSIVPIVGGGLRYYLVRGAPWSGAPTLSANAADSNGLTASASFSWALATPAPSPSPVVSATQSAPQASSSTVYPYGTDVSTFVWGAVYGGGQAAGLDPNFNIITNYQQVLAEACMRRWETPQGQYPNDPSYGWYVGQLINASVTQNDLTDAASAMAIQAQLDQRILSVSVTLTQVGRNLVITSRITPKPALGGSPFTLTANVSNLTSQLITPIGLAEVAPS